MSWLALGFVGVAAAVLLVLWLVASLAFGVTLAQLATGIYHAFKRAEPPSEADKTWDRDQGREAGGR